MIFRIAALGIGALAMYYFDPVSGNRRRARSATERRSGQRLEPDRREAQQRWPVDPVDIDLS